MLTEQFIIQAEAYAAEILSLEQRLVWAEGEATQLERKLTKAELERVAMQQEHDGASSELKKKLEKQNMVLCQEKKKCKATVQHLKGVVVEVCSL